MRVSEEVATQILEAIAEEAFDALDIDARVVKIAKIIQHHMLPKHTPGPDGHLIVYTHEGCMFRYCPNPIECQATQIGCVNIRDKTDWNL